MESQIYNLYSLFPCGLMETLVFWGFHCPFTWKKVGNGKGLLVTETFQCSGDGLIWHWNAWVREAIMLNKVLEEFPLLSLRNWLTCFS